MNGSSANARALARLRELHREEYERLVAEERGITERPCRVCGKANHRSVPTCSGECATVWRILRQHIGEHRDQQRLKNARCNMNAATDPRLRAQKQAHYERLAAGTTSTNGRWLIVGSETYLVALDCARRGLPIVTELPGPIQEQLEVALSELAVMS